MSPNDQIFVCMFLWVKFYISKYFEKRTFNECQNYRFMCGAPLHVLLQVRNDQELRYTRKVICTQLKKLNPSSISGIYTCNYKLSSLCLKQHELILVFCVLQYFCLWGQRGILFHNLISHILVLDDSMILNPMKLKLAVSLKQSAENITSRRKKKTCSQFCLSISQ